MSLTLPGPCALAFRLSYTFFVQALAALTVPDSVVAAVGISAFGPAGRVIAANFLAELRSAPPASLATFHHTRQQRWAGELVAWDASPQLLVLFPELMANCLDLVATCEKDVATVLAYATSHDGRQAINVAVPRVRAALRKRLLFLGRYVEFRSLPRTPPPCALNGTR